MSSTALARVQEANESLRQRLRAQRDRLKGEGRHLLRTGSGIAAGYALGMATAKWGDDAVAGMSPSLAVGVVATGVALLGVGGDEMGNVARGVGDVALGIFSYQKGFEHQQQREAEGEG